MPPKYVRTIREEIYYEYAKLMSRSAFEGQIQYAFVTDRFKALKTGEITMSGTIREWQKEQKLSKECVYCGCQDDLQTDHLVPKSRGGTNSADNLVLSCKKCNITRSNKGIFEWLGLKDKDNLHRLVAGKYLKELFSIHSQKGTLEKSLNELPELCSVCRNPGVCEKWDTIGKLTCFCLESVF